jgi:hypothetical protein
MRGGHDAKWHDGFRAWRRAKEVMPAPPPSLRAMGERLSSGPHAPVGLIRPSAESSQNAQNRRGWRRRDAGSNGQDRQSPQESRRS